MKSVGVNVHKHEVKKDDLAALNLQSPDVSERFEYVRG